jgi:hypothetical protein
MGAFSVDRMRPLCKDTRSMGENAPDTSPSAGATKNIYEEIDTEEPYQLRTTMES